MICSKELANKLLGCLKINDKRCDQYIEKCVKQDNPLIIDLINQYKNTIVSDREKGILNGRTILSQNKYFGVIMGKTD